MGIAVIILACFIILLIVVIYKLGRKLEAKDNQINAIKAEIEKQGKETNWKPSKEEMDVLYGLAYITNEYDEHKEEVITRLYQDLKREFFNGSSYENMFPNTEDGVRRRSTIQVLEYARSLDTYNQYGKADIDKNIAWLESQVEYKTTWKPTIEQINALTHFIRSIGESGYASPYDNNTKLLYSLLTDLQVLEKQGEQKELSQSKVTKKSNAWSEEDNERVVTIIDCLNTLYNDYWIDLEELNNMKQWLESLKQRMQ